jgi:hypothetical protein
MNNTQKFIHWITLTVREAAWAPLAVILFYGMGLAFHWYDAYPKLDIPSHLMGGVAITYFYRTAIRNSQQYLGDIPFPIQVLFAITSTGTTTVLWEFYENLSDYLIVTQHVKGLADTIQDLFVGLLGAVLLSLFYKRR